jgi:hypothetical protein
VVRARAVRLTKRPLASRGCVMTRPCCLEAEAYHHIPDRDRVQGLPLQLMPICRVGARRRSPKRNFFRHEAPTKITFGETRAFGVRDVLVYCRDHRCSHSTEISA